MTAETAGPGRLNARFEPDDFSTPPQEPPDDSVKLGIDESTDSSMTWIGYDEYEEHLAALAETEQAAFTDSTMGGTPSEPASSPAPAAETQPPDNAQDESGETNDPLAEIEAWLEASQVGPGPPAGEPTDPVAEAQALEDLLDSLERMLSEAPDPQPRQQATPPQPPAPQQPAQPSETDAPPTPPGEPADPSDQESDATSTRDVPLDDIKLGKPFASHGLRIKPRRPEFTTLTMLTAAPNNPLAELRFRRDGKPQRVRILKSSGDARIDEGILNSLYRWRASGKKLQELKKGETIPVRIQIVLFGE
jgi:outer membrane biosynthesis protein TonB